MVIAPFSDLFLDRPTSALERLHVARHVFRLARMSLNPHANSRGEMSRRSSQFPRSWLQITREIMQSYVRVGKVRPWFFLDVHVSNVDIDQWITQSQFITRLLAVPKRHNVMIIVVISINEHLCCRSSSTSEYNKILKYLLKD